MLSWKEVLVPVAIAAVAHWRQWCAFGAGSCG